MKEINKFEDLINAIGKNGMTAEEFIEDNMVLAGVLLKKGLITNKELIDMKAEMVKDFNFMAEAIREVPVEVLDEVANFVGGIVDKIVPKIKELT